MSKRSSSEIQNDSRKAVEVAGTRGKGGKSGSAHFWTEDTRKISSDDMRSGNGRARPGKTAKKHGGRRA